MKKLLLTFIILVLALYFTACGKNNNQTINDDQTNEETTTETISGKVTEVDGNKVTIAIITLENGQNENLEQQGETPPEKPNGESGETVPEKPDGEIEQQGETVPDKPDGESEQQGENPPDKPDGESGQQGETPPDKPDGESGQGETVPDKPDGESEQQGETPPDKPDGESSQGETPPDKPDGDSSGQNNTSSIKLTGETKTIEITDTSVIYKKAFGKETTASLSDIVVNSILTITYNNKSIITKILITSESDYSDIGGGQSSPGGSTSDVVYAGTIVIISATEETDKTYSSDVIDQSALLISTSENVTITNPTVSKTGDSNGGDNCNFYGQNATILVKDGSTTTIIGGKITSSATGANGVFSYGGNGGKNGTSGDGTTVIINDTEILTTGSGSGGIMTTGGGTTKASNLTVTTSGQSSAAIRTDRGGGVVIVNGGTYTTNGLGSPAIYSTANITVSNAELISNLSEGVCIEGLNSIELNNTNLTANNTKCNGNAKFYDTIMIYQSMSGDSASGTSTFTMNGGTLTSKKGHVIHVTNTSAIINLSNVTIVNEDQENILLSVCDDGWSGGSNQAILNANNQVLNGEIKVGSNSSLTLNMTNNSTFTGCINGNITNADGEVVSTSVGEVAVTLDNTSTWNLTADTYITSFNGDTSNINFNGYKLYVNGTQIQ